MRLQLSRIYSRYFMAFLIGASAGILTCLVVNLSGAYRSGLVGLDDVRMAIREADAADIRYFGNRENVAADVWSRVTVDNAREHLAEMIVRRKGPFTTGGGSLDYESLLQVDLRLHGRLMKSFELLSGDAIRYRFDGSEYYCYLVDSTLEEMLLSKIVPSEVPPSTKSSSTKP